MVIKIDFTLNHLGLNFFSFQIVHLDILWAKKLNFTKNQAEQAN